MVREFFCTSCMRTVYAGSASECPVCSSPLLATGEAVEDVPEAAAHPADVPEEIVPADEAQRLEAVRRYEILDTPRDGAFDRVTELAALIFDVPIATITIVDSDRIWFKSAVGIEVNETGREAGLCASAILRDEPWIVENAIEDPRAMENELVRGELGLRFYAGVPLTTADGYSVGTLNIIDKEPRELSDDQVKILEGLAQMVVDQLELRLAARRLYKDITAGESAPVG